MFCLKIHDIKFWKFFFLYILLHTATAPSADKMPLNPRVPTDSRKDNGPTALNHPLKGLGVMTRGSRLSLPCTLQITKASIIGTVQTILQVPLNTHAGLHVILNCKLQR
jgi:hypothetical protein